MLRLRLLHSSNDDEDQQLQLQQSWNNNQGTDHIISSSQHKGGQEQRQEHERSQRPVQEHAHNTIIMGRPPPSLSTRKQQQQQQPRMLSHYHHHHHHHHHHDDNANESANNNADNSTSTSNSNSQSSQPYNNGNGSLGLCLAVIFAYATCCILVLLMVRRRHRHGKQRHRHTSLSQIGGGDGGVCGDEQQRREKRETSKSDLGGVDCDDRHPHDDGIKGGHEHDHDLASFSIIGSSDSDNDSDNCDCDCNYDCHNKDHNNSHQMETEMTLISNDDHHQKKDAAASSNYLSGMDMDTTTTLQCDDSRDDDDDDELQLQLEDTHRISIDIDREWEEQEYKRTRTRTRTLRGTLLRDRATSNDDHHHHDNFKSNTNTTKQQQRRRRSRHNQHNPKHCKSKQHITTMAMHPSVYYRQTVPAKSDEYDEEEDRSSDEKDIISYPSRRCCSCWKYNNVCGSLCCGSWRSRLLDLLPQLDDESQHILKLSKSLCLTAAMEPGIELGITIMMDTWLGDNAVDAYLTSRMVIHMTSFVCEGLIKAQYTLCAQAIGSSGSGRHGDNTNGNGFGFALAGKYVHTAIVMELLLGLGVYLPLWYTTMHWILVHIFRFDDTVAALGQAYAKWYGWSRLLLIVRDTYESLLDIHGHEDFNTTVDALQGTTLLLLVFTIGALSSGPSSSSDSDSHQYLSLSLTVVGMAELCVFATFSVLHIWYACYRKGWLTVFFASNGNNNSNGGNNNGGLSLTQAKRCGGGGGGFLTSTWITNFVNIDSATFCLVLKNGFTIAVGRSLEKFKVEILSVFVASVGGPRPFAAWIILDTIWDFLEALPIGMAKACQIRVAHHLGRAASASNVDADGHAVEQGPQHHQRDQHEELQQPNSDMADDDAECCGATDASSYSTVQEHEHVGTGGSRIIAACTGTDGTFETARRDNDVDDNTNDNDEHSTTKSNTNHNQAAVHATYCALKLGFVCTTAVSFLVFVCRGWIPSWFTSDAVTIHLIQQALPLILIGNVVELYASVFSYTVEASGRFLLMTMVEVLVSACVTIPLSAAVVYLPGLLQVTDDANGTGADATDDENNNNNGLMGVATCIVLGFLTSGTILACIVQTKIGGGNGNMTVTSASGSTKK
jgi:Na+-driven multidrug efflux pump